MLYYWVTSCIRKDEMLMSVFAKAMASWKFDSIVALEQINICLVWPNTNNLPAFPFLAFFIKLLLNKKTFWKFARKR